MPDRAALLERFAAGTPWARATRKPLAGDASARHYQRWTHPDTAKTCILMDAPPGPVEGVASFVRIARHLVALGFSAPEIIAEDIDNGFLLIEDFGDGVFSRLIEGDHTCEAGLYEAAVDLLVGLQNSALPAGVTAFTPALMAKQASLALETYVFLPKRVQAFCAVLETVIAKHLSDPKVLILRDCHAENLIWLPERDGLKRVGLLDFQDAMAGPVGYDLISLIHDARRDVPGDLANRLVARFSTSTGQRPEAFEATRAVLCAQRNLRILGIFPRLAKVQGKVGYIDLIPRVWNHLTWAMAHPALAPIATFMQDLPPPTPDHLAELRSQCAVICR